MSTSQKHPNTIRHGGPGSSQENAKAPVEPPKPASDGDRRRVSKISGGGGEKDRHHSHDPAKKGGSA
jgi:hypothetical protein